MSRSTGVARRCPLLNEKVVPDYTNKTLESNMSLPVNPTKAIDSLGRQAHCSWWREPRDD